MLQVSRESAMNSVRGIIRQRFCRCASHVIWLLVLGVLSVGCSLPMVNVRQPVDTEGEVFLYLAPLVQDVGSLSFSLAEVAAVRDDGVSFPLSRILEKPVQGNTSAYRLLARGVVPPGRYQGVSFRFSTATVETDEATANLLVSQTPTIAAVPFTITARDTVVLESSFLAKQARSDLYALGAVFRVNVAHTPLPALSGYVTIPDEKRVVVFDKENGRVGKVIMTGASPDGVVFDREQRRAFVSLPDEDAIIVIDLVTFETLYRIRLYPGDHPGELALTPNGKVVLVVNESSHTVAFIDPVTFIELARVATGNQPGDLVIDRAGQRAYVANLLSGSVSVIDIPSRKLVTTIATESEPYRCQVTGQGDRLIVGHRRSPNLLVFDTLTGSLLTRHVVAGGVAALKIDATTDRVYVASPLGGPIELHMLTSLLPTDIIETEAPVEQFVIDKTNATLIAVQPTEHAVTIFSLISKAKRVMIDVGGIPHRVAVTGER